MTRRLFVFLLTLGICLAQVPSRHNTFTVTREHTLSAAAAVVTLQQPASASNTAQVMWFRIYSTADLTMELERDGAAATATAETEVGSNPNSPTPAVVAWYDSDVGNGTTIDTFDINSLENTSVDLSQYGIYLIGDGTGVNVSLRTSSETATVKITVCWKEW